MRELAVLPVRFLMTVLLTAVGLTVMHSLAVWGAYHNPQLAAEPSFGVPTVLSGFQFALPVATMLGIVTGMFAILRAPALRRMKLLAIWLTAIVVLGGGLALSTELRSWYGQAQPPARGIPPGLIHRTEGSAFYAEIREGTSYSGVVLFREGREPHFTLHDTAHENPFEGTVRVPDAGLSIPIADIAQSYRSLFEPPPVLGGLLADVRRTTQRILEAGRPTGNEYLAFVASMCLVMVSGWFFVRVSRWPILNGLLVVLLARGVLFIFRAGRDATLRESVAALLPVPLGVFFIPAILGALSVVLVALSVLLPPFREWQRDIAHG